MRVLEYMFVYCAASYACDHEDRRRRGAEFGLGVCRDRQYRAVLDASERRYYGIRNGSRGLYDFGNADSGIHRIRHLHRRRHWK